MTCLPCHRVFVGLAFCYSAEDVYLWIVSYHALIHAIECQFLSIGCPKHTFVYAKLVTVYALTIHDFPASIGCQLNVVAIRGAYMELLTFRFYIRSSLGFGIPFGYLALVSSADAPCCLFRFPVVQAHVCPVAQQYQWLARVRKRYTKQVFNLAGAVAYRVFVYFFQRE